MSIFMLHDKDFVEKLRCCDFFAGNREDFYKNIGNAILAHGAHRDPAPLVSIVIPTYKHPQWLKLTLESALAQEGFEDYEIIVVDNEGEPPEVETETSRLVCSYGSEKIVYYRNFPAAYYKMNTAFSLARSKWMCMVHDDDFISKDHLKIMAGIVINRPDIGYLACKHCSFGAGEEEACLTQAQQDAAPPALLRFLSAESACAGCWPGWLGVLINRENYIDMGGMFCSFTGGIGDFIMCMKYMDRYKNVYQARTEKSLYFYRISDAQFSSGGSDQWSNSLAAEYMLYKYLARKHHPNSLPFWNYMASILIHKKLRSLTRNEKWMQGGSIDAATIEELTGMPARNGRGVRFWIGKRLLGFVRRYYLKKSRIA